ncbi:hypothetical protein ACH4PW_31800 [Streptomyces sp. NPDC017082]|uniref:hypothetical protein n=1 Tax=Streptomyces sp. NPDC017082 TaxID=3364974 RepID=UPI0037B7DEB1
MLLGYGLSSILRCPKLAIGWWQRQGWITGDPTIGIERRPAPPDRTKALAENQIAALWRLDAVSGRRRSGRCSTSRRPAPTRCCA